MSKKIPPIADSAFEWWKKSKENTHNAKRFSILLVKVGPAYRTYGQDALAISTRLDLPVAGNVLEFSSDLLPRIFETMTRLGYAVTVYDMESAPDIPNQAEYELARKAFKAAHELDRRAPIYGLTVCFYLTPSMAMAVPDDDFYSPRTSAEIWLIGTPAFTPYRRNLEMQFKDHGERLKAKYCAQRVIAYADGNETEVSIVVNNLAANALSSGGYAAIIASKGMSEKLIPGDLELQQVVPLDGKHEMLFFCRATQVLEVSAEEMADYQKASCYELLPRDSNYKSSSAKTGLPQVLEINGQRWLVYGGSYQGGIEDPSSGKRFSRKNISAHLVLPADGPGDPDSFGWHSSEGCVVQTNQGWMRITGLNLTLSHKSLVEEKPVVVVEKKRPRSATVNAASPSVVPVLTPPPALQEVGQMNLF